MKKSLRHHYNHTNHAHKHQQTKSKGKMKFSHLVLIFLLLLFFTLVAILFYTGLPKTAPTSLTLTAPTPAEGVPAGLVRAPTPYLLLPQGRQEYLIKTNLKEGDALAKKIITDPLDAPKSSNQTISLEVSHNKPITAVKLALTTDNQTRNYSLNLVSGSETEGVWSGTWTMDDTHEKIYLAQFVITDSTNHKTTLDFPIR